MHPTWWLPFGLGPIATYPVVLALYLVVALRWLVRLNEQQQIPAATTAFAFAVGVPVGLVGVRLLDMLEYPTRYLSVADLFGRTGSSIYGGLLLNLIVTAAWLWSRGIPVGRFLDASTPVMALGEAMSRIGCFLNGCCYGVPWDGPFSVVFPAGSFAHADQQARGVLPAGMVASLPVHPVQLYSAALALVAAWWLRGRLARRRAAGEVFCAFLVFYGGLRLAMVPFRTEVLPSMTWFSVGFVVVGVVGGLCLRWSHRAHS